MRRLISRFVLLAAAALLLPLAAQAQAFRAYVASYGSDGNPCTVGLPCRLIPAALAVVASGGEIWMLDSANFNSGTLNINKSVTIKAIPGQVGSIVAVAGGAAINMGNVTLRLQNVAIMNNAVNPGTDGIVMASGGNLQVHDSLIAGLGNGIAATDGIVTVNNSLVRDNLYGVRIAGNGFGDIADTRFIDNSNYAVWSEGSVASTTPNVNVSNCSATRGYVAFIAFSTVANANARMNVTRSSAAGSQYGVVAVSSATGASVTTTVGSSSFFNSGTAGMMQQGTGAVLESLGNNQVRGNISNTAGTITTVGAL